MNDLRFAWRQLLKNPGFTAVAVLALALGIGANTAIFSVVNSVLLRPLPYHEPERLVRVYENFLEQGWRQNSVAAGNYLDWRAYNTTCEDMAVMGGGDLNLTGDSQPIRVKGARVSSSFFNVLKVSPAIGRAFLPENDQHGNEYVAILSHGFWKTRFGGDPNALGRTIMLNLRNHEIIGVMPANFRFMDPDTQILTPLAFTPDQIRNRGSHSYRVIARLKPGVSLAQVDVDLDAVSRRAWEEQYMKGWGVDIVPLQERIVGKARPALLLLLGSVGFVLLIACANVANLLLARSASRQKEFAIRAALGASRGRVIRQLLTESLLLAALGAGLGLLLAFWGIDALVALSPANLPRVDEIGIDARVLAFTAGIACLTGLLFGLAPALQSSRPDLNETLKDSGRSSDGIRRSRLRGALVVSEVALSFVPLVCAGLLIHDFTRLLDQNLGFNAEHLLTADIALPGVKYPELESRRVFIDELLQRVAALPGVKAVGANNNLPLSGSGNSIAVSVVGKPKAAPGEPIAAGHRQISPGYFRTMGTPFVEGRDFDNHDQTNSLAVAIVNQTFVRKFLANASPIGQRINIGDSGPNPAEIVGLVKDTKHVGLDTDAAAEMYFPYMQRCWGYVTLVVRTSVDPNTLAASIRRELLAIDKDQPLHNVRTMTELISNSVAQRRFAMMLLAVFAGLALILAAIGIYGVVSYAVTQRTHEIGIRMSLGAQRADVLRLIIGQGMLLALFGVGIGLAAAFGLTRTLANLMYGVSPRDPLTFGLVAVLLGLVALLACYLPGRRATRVDPITALRQG